MEIPSDNNIVRRTAKRKNIFLWFHLMDKVDSCRYHGPIAYVNAIDNILWSNVKRPTNNSVVQWNDCNISICYVQWALITAYSIDYRLLTFSEKLHLFNDSFRLTILIKIDFFDVNLREFQNMSGASLQ